MHSHQRSVFGGAGVITQYQQQASAKHPVSLVDNDFYELKLTDKTKPTDLLNMHGPEMR